MSDLNQTLKDGAYAAVGLGVLGFQKAQVRRHELAAQFDGMARAMEEHFGTSRPSGDDGAPSFETQLLAMREQLMTLIKLVDRNLQPAREEVDRQMAEIEERLPETARGAMHTVRRAVVSSDAPWRSVVGLD